MTYRALGARKKVAPLPLSDFPQYGQVVLRSSSNTIIGIAGAIFGTFGGPAVISMIAGSTVMGITHKHFRWIFKEALVKKKADQVLIGAADGWRQCMAAEIPLRQQREGSTGELPSVFRTKAASFNYSFTLGGNPCGRFPYGGTGHVPSFAGGRKNDHSSAFPV